MKSILITFTAILFLTACQQSKVTESAMVDKKTADSTKVVSTVPTTNMRFEHRLSAERAQVGVPFEIQLDFSGSSDSVLNTEFSASSGLQMMSKETESFQVNKSGKVDTHTITIVPQSEGIHYVNIIQPGAKEKPSVIRVIAGDKDIKEYLQTPGTVVEQEDGSKVISMKADEG